MPKTRNNTQLFALASSPPEILKLKAGQYRLVKVFKHDFYAATCLYEAAGQAGIPKIVVKFGRAQLFCGLDLSWMGNFLRKREKSIYKAIAGIDGVPRWVESFGDTGYAIEYVQGHPLDHVTKPPAGFFDELRKLFDAIHSRGVAYSDANKRSNIIVGADGKPYLVDYQISVRRRKDWPWPFCVIVDKIVDYMIAKDIYHLYKHKRRISPAQLTPEEDALSRKRSGIHLIHRKLTKPYRALRRGFLKKKFQDGSLVSPTIELEEHHQPEKVTWRNEKG